MITTDISCNSVSQPTSTNESKKLPDPVFFKFNFLLFQNQNCNNTLWMDRDYSYKFFSKNRSKKPTTMDSILP